METVTIDNITMNKATAKAAPQLLEELEKAIQSLEHLNGGPHKGTERAKAVIEAATQ